MGFRFTSQRLARGFDVAGSVRNLRDGRVELIVEGDPAEVDAFLHAVRDAMEPYIEDATVESCTPSSPPLAGFTIRHS